MVVVRSQQAGADGDVGGERRRFGQPQLGEVEGRLVFVGAGCPKAVPGANAREPRALPLQVSSVLLDFQVGRPDRVA